MVVGLRAFRSDDGENRSMEGRQLLSGQTLAIEHILHYPSIYLRDIKFFRRLTAKVNRRSKGLPHQVVSFCRVTMAVFVHDRESQRSLEMQRRAGRE